MSSPQYACGPLLGHLLSSSRAISDASWAPLGRFLGRLGHQVGGILEASGLVFYAPSHSLSSAFYFGRLLDPKCLILVHIQKAENQLNASRLAFSWFSGVEVGVKKRRQDRPRQAKTDQDKTRQDKTGFWWIFEAKLGLEKGAKTGRDRPRQAKTRKRGERKRRERREERRGERREERGERKRENGDFPPGVGWGLPAY